MARKDISSIYPDSTQNKTKSKLTQLSLKSPKRGKSAWIQVLSATLLKAAVFIFLRWIPSRLLVYLIPTLFFLYLTSSLIQDVRIRYYLRQVLERAQIQAASDDLVQLASKTTNGNGEISNPTLGDSLIGNSHQAEKDTLKEKEKLKKLESSNASIFSIIKLLILGLSCNSRFWNLLSLAFHTMLIIFSADFAISPFLFPSVREGLFIGRVGSIGPNQASLHVRYPNPLPTFFGFEETTQSLRDGSNEEMEVDEILGLRDGSIIVQEPLRVVYREVEVGYNLHHGKSSGLGAKRWEKGPLLRLTNETDWNVVVKLENLFPSTEYEWRLAFIHNNTFAPHPSQSLKFTTWPDPREGGSRLDFDEDGVGSPLDDPNLFTFVSSSCVKPDFPYHPAQWWGWNNILRHFDIGTNPGGITERNRIQGFDKMAERYLSGSGKGVRFFLELGDLVYADVPWPIGTTKDRFEKLYRNLFDSSSFRRVFEKIPIIGCMDDHEIQNNHGGTILNDEGLIEPLDIFENGQTAWKEFIGDANPEPLVQGENYYTFTYGSETSFFVWDTRKFRTPASEEDDEYKTMLGNQQKQDFLNWLSAVNSTSTFKFVASSVPFLTMWGGPLDVDSQSDSWAAYQTERRELMDVMQYVPNLIVLSGDRHEFASAGIGTLESVERGQHPVVEFSTSPLSMFYLPVRTLAQENNLGSTGEDKLYKYLPDGNVKWTEFTVNTRDPLSPFVDVRVVIDGEVAWKVKIVGKQVKQPPQAIGGMAKHFLELLGFKKLKWF